ncbi:MAG: DUF4825 domain-containing protein [Firmicutes bacterium]|nr:DUF4825 domain-containing protein [Bacillota bacterium]MBQ6662584.1 DUF4825 domain-containing protein [Bacillota bacterium]
MNKIPCEVIRDLFPSYIDQLTSPVTNEAIAEHLHTCDACRDVLAAMRGSEGDALPGTDGEAMATETGTEEDRKTLDFLKKNRKRNHRIVLVSLLAALLIAGGALAARAFLIGSESYADSVYWQADVDGKNLCLQSAVTDSMRTVSKVEFREEDGVVTATSRLVLVSPFHTGSMVANYQANQDIREVIVDGRTIWAEGKEISALAAAVFETRHEYIGDASANGRTAAVLNLSAYLGPFTNDLDTEARPYTWGILLEDDVPARLQVQRESDMESFAYLLLGLVENCDAIRYEYTLDGKRTEKTVTTDDAGRFFGSDVKDCYKSVRKLDALLAKTGLNSYAFADPDITGNPDEIGFALWIGTEEKLKYIDYAIYLGDELISSGGGMNADESLMEAGERMSFYFTPEQLGQSGFDDLAEEELTVELSVTTANGKQYGVEGRVRIPAVPGTTRTLYLSGSAEDGFTLGQ